jgi:hypothetical protein
MRRRTMLVFACLILALTMATPTTVASADDAPAFVTGRPSMLDPVMAGVSVTPLLTVGEADPFPNWSFEAIPDGISVRVNDDAEIELYVNHETSKVPFPWGPLASTPVPPTAANSEADFDNSQVSKIIVDSTGNVISGEFAIPSSEGFQRFCSNFLATEAEGFTKDILFTNEESPDYVFRQEDSWPPPIGAPDEEENGLVVALDVDTGEYRPIYGMGRHNHENSVAIPGFDRLVLLSGDDTFTSGPLTIPAGGPIPAGTAPSQSQLYSYMAGNTKNVLEDKGNLWAFVSDDLAVNDYYDFSPGSTNAVSGRFIKVPRNIATGKDADGTEIQSEDVGFPEPPTNGSWQRDPRPPAGTSVGIDGPQWVLEYWGQLNNVFNFVRVEDIAYDKRPGMENVVYVVDSGRGTAGASQAGRSTNGRVWKMVLDPDNPRKVDSLSIFVEGDDNPVKTLDEIHQPDNLETTQTGILVTEDPGSSQQFILADQGLPNATTARLWNVPFSGSPSVVAKVNQAQDGDAGIDVDGRPDGNWGAWESSGIVDASEAFGPGWFLIDVQAHTLWTEQAPGDDDFAPAGPDLTKKREGGQLLKIYIPATIPPAG